MGPLGGGQQSAVLRTFRIDMTGGSLTHIDLRRDQPDAGLAKRAEHAIARIKKALPGEAIDATQPTGIPFRRPPR